MKKISFALVLMSGFIFNALGATDDWRNKILDHQVRIHGNYINGQYCFTIKQFGFPMYKEKSPSPNHGVFIVLGKDRTIWAGAISNAAEYETNIETIHIDDEIKLKEETIDFSGKPATKVTSRSGDKFTINIAQIRNDKGNVYKIIFTSTLDYFDRDTNVLNMLLRYYTVHNICKYQH